MREGEKRVPLVTNREKKKEEEVNQRCEKGGQGDQKKIEGSKKHSSEDAELIFFLWGVINRKVSRGRGRAGGGEGGGRRTEPTKIGSSTLGRVTGSTKA